MPHKLTDEQKANGWKLLEISLPCVTRIHPLCEPSSQGMRPGATSSIGNPSGNRRNGVQSSPRPKKSRLQKSNVKTVLIAFDSDGIIHKEFIPAGQTVNSTFYEEVLKQLLRSIHSVRPELHRTGQWMLLHDNAPTQCAIRVQQFLAQRGVRVSIIHHTSMNWRMRTSFCFPYWRLNAGRDRTAQSRDSKYP